MTKHKVYKQAKTGDIQVYETWTEGADIVTQYGKLDGKMQTSRVTCVGKNIGKSNETTPEEQAVSQMLSKLQLKRDKGYFDTVEEAENEIVFLPMLAKDGRKVKITYPCYAQPKLDGVRCMASKKIGLMSRGGKPYPVKHIEDSLPPSTIPEVVFDGELYIHGMALQDLRSLVVKPKEGSQNVEYWIFDLYFPGDDSIPWSRRMSYLNTLVPNLAGFNPKIKLVKTETVNNEAEMKALHDKYVAEGFEGIILRSSDGTYVLGHRSSNLIKYKEFDDDEFLIIGYREGVGKFEGCVIWECETADGDTFEVVPKGTLEMKKKWFNEANDIVGKELTVRYQGFTNDGIPQFPVGITIRDYE